MDYNLIITALVLSSIYFCCVVLKCKYVTKEKVNLKSIMIDTIIVLLLTFVTLNVLPMLSKKTKPQAFTDKPKF